jgi:hypothetical protein
MRRRRPLTLWLVAFALGAGAALLAAAIGILGIVFVLLIIPGISGRTWLAATSGALTAFGAVWLLLMARQAGSGGAVSSSDIWLLVGAVPLAIGALLSLVALIAARRARA